MSLELPAQALRRLLLVDGHAYAYRAFYAIRSLRGPDGAPTNAVFGFVKMMLKLRDTLCPEAVVVVWDAGLSAERTAALPGYKANRPPMPPDLERQEPEIAAWLDAVGWPQWRETGAEADDWLATLARRAAGKGWEPVIASSDKDFMQLVEGPIRLLNPTDKSEKLWTAGDVEAKTGVKPRQVVDFLSLMGDAVDNIPGVPGIGPKTAAALLRRFESVDGILSRLMEIKSDRVRSDLLGAKDDLRRNQEMIRLRDNLPGGLDVSELISKPANEPRLRELYKKWGFKGLLAQLETLPLSVLSETKESAVESRQESWVTSDDRQGRLF